MLPCAIRSTRRASLLPTIAVIICIRTTPAAPLRRMRFRSRCSGLNNRRRDRRLQESEGVRHGDDPRAGARLLVLQLFVQWLHLRPVDPRPVMMLGVKAIVEP